MTANFDSSSLFSFSADSCCDDDEVAAAYESKSAMLPNGSRLSYLTVMSEQIISSSRKFGHCRFEIKKKRRIEATNIDLVVSLSKLS